MVGAPIAGAVTVSGSPLIAFVVRIGSYSTGQSVICGVQFRCCCRTPSCRAFSSKILSSVKNGVVGQFRPNYCWSYRIYKLIADCMFWASSVLERTGCWIACSGLLRRFLSLLMLVWTSISMAASSASLIPLSSLSIQPSTDSTCVFLPTAAGGDEWTPVGPFAHATGSVAPPNWDHYTARFAGRL